MQAPMWVQGFEAKRVLEHWVGSGPTVQKRNFRQGETSRKNQTLEEAQGEVCASYFGLKKTLSQEGGEFQQYPVCLPRRKLDAGTLFWRGKNAALWI